MSGLFHFLSKNYTESPLEFAKKRAGKDDHLRRTLEVLDSNPQAGAEDIARVLGYQVVNGKVVAGQNVSPEIVQTYYLPRAHQLLQEARDKLVPAVATSGQPAPTSQNQEVKEGTIVVNVPPPGTQPVAGTNAMTIDDIEQENLHLVINAGAVTTWESKLRRWSISFFKTLGPYFVLLLTIPETIWVFTHIYASVDGWLVFMTWVFAFTLDFGYLAITNLVAANKENLNTKRVRGQPIEAHERLVVRKQTAAWWIVATLDSGSQIVFLVVATWGSHVFPLWLTLGLAMGRVLDLGVVMWLVSFAGVELTTRIQQVVNERMEMAVGLSRLSDATNVLREAQQEARIRLEEKEMDLNRRREETDFLADLRRQSFEEIRELKREAREHHQQISGSRDDQKKLP